MNIFAALLSTLLLFSCTEPIISSHRIQWSYVIDNTRWIMVEKEEVRASGSTYLLYLEADLNQFTPTDPSIPATDLERLTREKAEDSMKKEILRGVRDRDRDTSLVNAKVDFRNGFVVANLSKAKVRGTKIAELFSDNVIKLDSAEPRPDLPTAPDI